MISPEGGEPEAGLAPLGLGKVPEASTVSHVIPSYSQAPHAMEHHACRTKLSSGLTVDAARELAGYLRANGDAGDHEAARGVASLASGVTISPLPGPPLRFATVSAPAPEP